MTRHLVSVVVLIAAILVRAPALIAQDPQPVPAPLPLPAPAAAKPLVPLDIQIVVARYNGEKKISSLPYSLAVNANEPQLSRLRMGANVPIASQSRPKPANGQPSSLPVPYTYQSIGTNIDCQARTTDDGRFQVMISVEDSSVYANVQDATTPAVDDVPVIRSFKSTNTLLLRDGQTRQFSVATDRISGDVVKIDVTLKVVK